MKILLHEDSRYFLRFDYGEDIIKELAVWAKKQQVGAAFFTVIGATNELILCYYDVEAKKYLDHHLKEDLEIISIHGSISALDDQLIVHAHGAFSDRHLQVKAGHLKKMVVSITAEVMLTTFTGTLKRTIDQKTGLPLL